MYLYRDKAISNASLLFKPLIVYLNDSLFSQRIHTLLLLKKRFLASDFYLSKRSSFLLLTVFLNRIYIRFSGFKYIGKIKFHLLFSIDLVKYSELSFMLETNWILYFLRIQHPRMKNGLLLPCNFTLWSPLTLQNGFCKTKHSFDV